MSYFPYLLLSWWNICNSVWKKLSTLIYLKILCVNVRRFQKEEREIKNKSRSSVPALPIIINRSRIGSVRNLGKQPTFRDATNGLTAKWRLRNERRNSILMTRHYPDLGSASDWSCRVGNLIQPIRSTTQIWVVTRHQYGISAFVSQTSFRWETSGSVTKCRLFSQAAQSVER